MRRHLILAFCLAITLWRARLAGLSCTGATFAIVHIYRRKMGISLQALPEKAEEGLRARIEYVGTLENGTIFASTEGQEPLDFVVGEEESWVDEVTLGMVIGESRDLTLGKDKPIFGSWTQELVRKVPLDQLPSGLQAGSEIWTRGGEFPMVVLDVNDTEATIDTNHPLVDTVATMSVKLVGLEELPESERVVIERISPGDGTTYPRRRDRVKVHYTGTLLSTGTQFDTSRDGEPLEFQIGLGQVVAGWDRGIRKLSLGERAVLRIPSKLGYGKRGASRDIPPDSDLEFDVELIAIN